MQHVEALGASLAAQPPAQPSAQTTQPPLVSESAAAGLRSAVRSFLGRTVQLLFDHWELSFQSLTNMLPPLLTRTQWLWTIPQWKL